MCQTCIGFRWVLTGPFSCKPLLEWFSGWVVSYFVLRQKAILHHLICSSHANKRRGGELNRTNSTSLPPHYTAHTRSPFWLWQKNNNNTIVFVSFTNGRSWKTSLSPSHQPCPSVNAIERVCVSFTISPCQPTYTYSLRTSVLLKLSAFYISALRLSLSLSDHMRFAENHWFIAFKRKARFPPSVALYINMFVPAISLAKTIMQMLS